MKSETIYREAVKAVVAAYDFCGDETDAIKQVEADYDVEFDLDELVNILHEAHQEIDKTRKTEQLLMMNFEPIKAATDRLRRFR